MSIGAAIAYAAVSIVSAAYSVYTFETSRKESAQAQQRSEEFAQQMQAQSERKSAELSAAADRQFARQSANNKVARYGSF